MLCDMCGFSGWAGARCPDCGAPTSLYELDGFGHALIALLALDAAAGLCGVFASGMRAAAGLLTLPIVIMFLVWFYRARLNAIMFHSRQRYSAGWAIGSWFVPVIFLWVPYKIMVDIYRAGRSANARRWSAWLLGGWWTCWILAWLTGFRHETIVSGTGAYQSAMANYVIYFDGTRLSALFAAAAAILLAVIVRQVSTGGVGGTLPASRPATTLGPSYPWNASG